MLLLHLFGFIVILIILSMNLKGSTSFCRKLLWATTVLLLLIFRLGFSIGQSFDDQIKQLDWKVGFSDN